MLTLICPSQRPQNLPVYGSCQNRRHGISYLLPDLPRSESICHGKRLQAGKLPIRESPSAGWVVVELAAPAGHRPRLLVGVKGDPAAIAQAAVQRALYIVVCGSWRDAGDDGVDGFEFFETRARETVCGLGEGGERFSWSAGISR